MSNDDSHEATATKPTTCFVIGPIGNKFAPLGSEDRVAYEEALQVWEEVIQPACAHVGLEPVRADGLARAGEITEQIFRRLRDDDVVIADLTGANANVMYELGLRHSKNHLTVQIGEYGRLPFDINVIRTIMFSRSPRALINARNELAEFLGAGLEGEYDIVSATRVWIEQTRETDTVPDTDAMDVHAPAADEDEAPGFLDLVAESEARSDDLIDATGAIGRAVEKLGELATDASAEMQRSDTRGAGMRGRLAVATRFASKIDALAAELEGDVERYVSALDAVSSGNLAMIDAIAEDRTQLADGLDWAMLTRRNAKIARESVASLSDMMTSMQGMARLSRVLRPPTRRIADALQRFGAATSTLDKWDRRLQSLGVHVPPDDWEPDLESSPREPASAPE